MQKQVWKDGACQERFTFDAVGVQLLGWTLCERFVEEGRAGFGNASDWKASFLVCAFGDPGPVSWDLAVVIRFIIFRVPFG